MKWKVCGMRDAANIEEVLRLQPNFMGFIFYEKSPRFVGDRLPKLLLKNFPRTTQKVGVFVNASTAFVMQQVADYELDMVQLHGQEPVAECQYYQAQNIPVIKAISVGTSADLEATSVYAESVDFFLFDTKAPQGYGGHGVAFDWQILTAYQGNIPFFLAGGIDLDNLPQALAVLQQHPQGYALDLNSRFEITPALKDVDKLLKISQLLTN